MNLVAVFGQPAREDRAHEPRCASHQRTHALDEAFVPERLDIGTGAESNLLPLFPRELERRRPIRLRGRGTNRSPRIHFFEPLPVERRLFERRSGLDAEGLADRAQSGAWTRDDVLETHDVDSAWIALAEQERVVLVQSPAQ